MGKEQKSFATVTFTSVMVVWGGRVEGAGGGAYLLWYLRLWVTYGKYFDIYSYGLHMVSIVISTAMGYIW